MKTFPTIILGAFVALGVIGVFIFATFTAIQQDAVGTVRVWGTLSTNDMQPVLLELRTNNSAFDSITYESKSPDRLIPELVAAIASGQGPDLVFFPASYVLSDSDKLLSISYSSYSRRDFQNTFIEAGEIFLDQDGIRGLPVLVDPLVMYWNRALFSSAGIAEPPRYWDDVTAITPALAVADERGTLLKSAVAFGTWDNVRHAKAILLSIFKQLGEPVVAQGEEGYVSVLNAKVGQSTFSASSALRFYTDFADPVKTVYSWNRSQPNSRDAFIAGALAMYFGRASELFAIRDANPNLNFDVAPVPGIRGGSSGTAADLVGLSIPRGAKNPGGALVVAQALVEPNIQSIFEQELHLPSVRRDALSSDPNNPYTSVFRNAALSSFAFPDPNPTATDSIFRRMTESVSSGNLTVSEAVSNASLELQALIGVQ